jgi:uncharacterized lipoprotein
MNIHKRIFVACLVALLAACGSSPEQEKAAAEAKYTDEKTKTLQEYKSCVKKAEADQAKLDACERLLKAAQ